MQVIALVPLFAKPLQPMLAYEVVVMRGTMFIWTVVAKGTKPFAESLAEWTVGIKTEAVFALEEICECEVVDGSGTRLLSCAVISIHGDRPTTVRCDSHDFSVCSV